MDGRGKERAGGTDGRGTLLELWNLTLCQVSTDHTRIVDTRLSSGTFFGFIKWGFMGRNCIKLSRQVSRTLVPVGTFPQTTPSKRRLPFSRHYVSPNLKEGTDLDLF